MRTILVVLALISASFLSSAQIKSGDNIVVDEETNGDLYVAGGTVTINSLVNGDLLAAGGTININDSIAQDALLAGGNIFVNGVVKDDIRCAGGAIHISANVFGDLVVAGGKVTIDKDVQINGDLLVSGGEITVNGRINGEIESASGAFALNGIAASKIDCRGGKVSINGEVLGPAIVVAEEMKIGSNASFAKGVRYWTREGNVDFQESVRSGKAIFDAALEPESGRWHYLGFASLLMVIWYLGTALIFIVLIHYLFENTFMNAANTVRNASLKSLGWGVLFLVGVPITIIVAAITIIGLPIGALILVAYITIILLGTVIVSLLIANWVNNTYYKTWTSATIIFTAFGIFIVLKLASLTPVVGPLIMLLMVCMAFGGILLNIKWKRNATLA